MTSTTPSDGAHLGDRLSALVDGELAVDQARAAERHLATCPTCRTEYELTERAHELVVGLPLLTLPPPVWARTMAGMRRRPRPLVWAGAAAAVVGLSMLAASPSPHRVTPQMAHLVQQHTVSSGSDPVTQLAPAAIPASFGR
jgi:anti-sigma factor RsiW